MTDLIATKRALAEENEDRVLRVLAAAGDAGVSPGDLYAAAELAERTGRAAVDRLVERNLVVRVGRRRIVATVAGRAEVDASLPGVRLEGALSTAIDLLPAEAMRAFVRLLLSGIVSRHHLHRSHPQGWGSFVVVGPTKTGKTSMASIACEAFGLERATAIRLAMTETAHSLWGRRRQGPGGYVLEPSPALQLPFLCVDEFDKAAAELRTRLMVLAQGEALVPGEGTGTLEVAPTVLFCANGGPELIHPAYRRRSVVLDLTPLAPLLTDISGPVTAILGPRRALPRLDLGRTTPPLDMLPDELRTALLDQLRAGLTEEGWSRCDEQAVQYLALGRAALVPGGSVAQAVMATVADYLTCAGTVGEARPGTPPAVLEALGGGHLVPERQRAETELNHQAHRRRQADVDHLELIGLRSGAVEKLRMARASIQRVPDEHRATAAGLRDVLRELVARVGAQRSMEGLRASIEDALPYVRQAEELRSGINQAKAAADRERMQAAADKRADAEERRRTKAAVEKRQAADRAGARESKMRRTARTQQLQRLVDRRRPKPNEDAVAVLVDAGVLRRDWVTVKTQKRPFVATVGARLRGATPPASQEVSYPVLALTDATGAPCKAEDVQIGSPAFRRAIFTAAAAERLTLSN